MKNWINTIRRHVRGDEKQEKVKRKILRREKKITEKGKRMKERTEQKRERVTQGSKKGSREKRRNGLCRTKGGGLKGRPHFRVSG